MTLLWMFRSTSLTNERIVLNFTEIKTVLIYGYIFKRIFYQFSDTMENWDEAQLEEVINKKHGEAEKAKPKTAIVSIKLLCNCQLNFTRENKL